MLTTRLFFCGLILAAATGVCSGGQVPVEGFLPLVGIALTDQFRSMDDPGQNSLFFIAEKSEQPGGSFLGPGANAHYDIALFDTGAATHILTNATSLAFSLIGEGFQGSNTQQIGGATGQIDLRIDLPLGVYVTGLEHTTSASGAPITFEKSSFRGQTSFSLLSAPEQWKLPNVIGLPMAAQHKVHIRNSAPQIKDVNGRTVRTPEIEFLDLGPSGPGEDSGEGILRRATMDLVPGLGFVQGPIYQFGLDIFNLNFSPTSPTVIPNSALFVDTDLANNGHSLQDSALFFDTGASLTVLSEQTAAKIGIDPILDTPDFKLVVEGSGGISTGIPGFIIDELNLDTVGGSFSLTDVPVAVMDVTNPADPGNIVDGILGMNLFVGRDLVIDANPSVGQGGTGPSIYISDPVTRPFSWQSAAASGDWVAAKNWSSVTTPDVLSDAMLANVSGSHQEAFLSASATVFRVTVSGSPSADMKLRVSNGSELVVFADLEIMAGGYMHLDGGVLDAQFVQMPGGALTGSGDIFLGSGSVNGAVRNEGGVVDPGDASKNLAGTIDIVGDFGTGAQGTVVFDLGGVEAGVNHDQVLADRLVFLDGTLEVRLADLGNGQFTPQVGDSFVLITAGDELQGRFETTILPTGFSWSVDYTDTSLVLTLGSTLLVGDFDGGGNVDLNDLNLVLFDWNRDGATVSTNWVNQRPEPGTVVGLDTLNEVLFNWGVTNSSGLVPEPNGTWPLPLAWLGCGFMSAGGLRRRRHDGESCRDHQD